MTPILIKEGSEEPANWGRSHSSAAEYMLGIQEIPNSLAGVCR